MNHPRMLIHLSVLCLLLVQAGCVSTYKARKYEKKGEWRAAYGEIELKLQKEPDNEKLLQLRVKYGNVITNTGLEQLNRLHALNLTGRLNIINDISKFVSKNQNQIRLELENTSKKEVIQYTSLQSIVNGIDVNELVEGVLRRASYIANDSKAKSLTDTHRIVGRFEDHYLGKIQLDQFEDAQRFYSRLLEVEKVWAMRLCNKLEKEFRLARVSYVKKYLLSFCQSKGHDLMRITLMNAFGSNTDIGQNVIRLDVHNAEDALLSIIREQTSIDGYKYELVNNANGFPQNDLAYLQIHVLDYGNKDETSSSKRNFSRFKSGQRMVANPRYIQARDHYQIAQNNYNVELQNYNLRYSNWIQAYNHHAQYGNQYIFAAGNPKPSSPSTYSLNGAAHILQKIPPQLQEDIYQDYQYPSYTFVKKYSLKCSFESHDFAGGSISPNDLFQRQDSDQYFFNREVHPEDTQVRQIPPPSPSKLKADYREFLRKSFSSIHSKIASSCEKRLETIFSEAVRDKDSFTAHRALLSKGTFSSEVAFIHNFIPDLFTEIRSGLSKSDAYAHYLQFYSEHLFDRSVGIAEVQTMLQGPWNVKTLSEQNLKPSAPRPLVTNPDAIKQTGLGQLDHVIKSTFTLKNPKWVWNRVCFPQTQSCHHKLSRCRRFYGSAGL